MTRVLFVAQDKGGVGKTTLVRAIVELEPNLQIFEVDTTPSYAGVRYQRGRRRS